MNIFKKLFWSCIKRPPKPITKHKVIDNDKEFIEEYNRRKRAAEVSKRYNNIYVKQRK